MTPPRMVHAAMAARELGVSLATVKAWCSPDGPLVGRKGKGRYGRWYVTRASIEAFVKAKAPGPKTEG